MRESQLDWDAQELQRLYAEEKTLDVFDDADTNRLRTVHKRILELESHLAAEFQRGHTTLKCREIFDRSSSPAKLRNTP